MPSKQRIFISHISAEAELAAYLKKRLSKDFKNVEVFVSSDGVSIELGKKWLEAVEKALSRATAEIVLCSKASVSRPWVNFEAGAVWLRGIPVIPVCHSGLAAQELPAPLSFLQGIEAGSVAGLQQLYANLAKKFRMRMPAVDFDALASDIRQIEKAYQNAASKAKSIDNPLVLCAATAQYAQPALGFDLDVKILEQQFPGRVVVERDLTRKRLVELLTDRKRRFDIVHLVVAVDPRDGSIIFSPIDVDTLKPATSMPDILPPTGFANLLRDTQASLVVLATCNALLLAVEVAHVANMAASDAVITGEEAAEWEGVFYSFLAQGRALYEAFELTRSAVATPIRPIRFKDVCFTRPSKPSRRKQ
jgi:hypothetical protein